MEADRPGWCDALNGLPGLFGSSVNETIELKRLADFTRQALADLDGECPLPLELALWCRCCVGCELRINSRSDSVAFTWNTLASR